MSTVLTWAILQVHWVVECGKKLLPGSWDHSHGVCQSHHPLAFWWAPFIHRGINVWLEPAPPTSWSSLSGKGLGPAPSTRPGLVAPSFTSFAYELALKHKMSAGHPVQWLLCLTTTVPSSPRLQLIYMPCSAHPSASFHPFLPSLAARAVWASELRHSVSLCFREATDLGNETVWLNSRSKWTQAD